MNNISNLYNKKQSLIYSIINDKNNNSFFKHLDNILITQYFRTAKELSQIEEILTIDTYNMSKKEVFDIINHFIYNSDNKKINLFDIIKISNNQNNKIIKNLPKNILSNLGDRISNVSRETTLIGNDFALLKILDNFLKKNIDIVIQNKYIKIKKTILTKILLFNYTEQKNELDNSYLCWIDRLLLAVFNNEINIADYIKINKKLLYIIPEKTEIYWKIINSINYLSFNSEYNNASELRKFKRELLKSIKKKFDFYKPSRIETEKNLIKTLAEPFINKENFYYLFNMIKKLANNSFNDKYFCLNIIDYLIYVDQKYNFFNHRFIREAFFTTFFDLLNSFDNMVLKEKEYYLLIKLLNIKYFFYHNKKDILSKMSALLCDFCSEKDISVCKCNKYIDAADYIFTNNKELIKIDVIEKISQNSFNYKKTYNRFNLYLA